MVAGHIGVAAGAKAFDRKIPFWVLLIASFVIDMLAWILIPLGVESMHAMSGTDGGYGQLVYKVDWSHALFTAMFLSTLALVIGARRFRIQGGFIIACVVFSHWFLDVIVHRPDMPIAPGNAGNLPRFGLGLWDAPIASMLLEALLVVGGAYLWYRTRSATPESERDQAWLTKTPRYAGLALVGGLLVLLADALS